MTGPVALFVYARRDHTRRTVEALLNNPEAADTDLIIFSDAAKTPDKASAVQEVRDYIDNIRGFRSVIVHKRPHNFGLAKSIIQGVTQVLGERDTVIVLEDDMITSPHFLAYMNEGLIRYALDERVISLHGYMYPVSEALPEAFFLRGADCWGWATWRRGWSFFNPDGQFLLDELKRQKLLKAFDFNGSYGYSDMLRRQIAGRNDSWAIRWYASAFLADKLTLYPSRSLVQNIGVDGSGTHCSTSNALEVSLSNSPIDLSRIHVDSSQEASQAIERFFRRHRSPLKKLPSRLLNKINYSLFVSIAKDWLPPIVRNAFRKMHLGKSFAFQGPVESWDEAVRISSGYDSPKILDQVLAATLKVKNGEAAYERDSVLFDKIEYAWPVIAGLMWAAAQNEGRLSVLDFGGSLGSTYFNNRQFLGGIPNLRWSVVEQPHFVEVGERCVKNGPLRFYEGLDDCVSAEKPSVVLLSSVLQYLEDPYEILEKLSATEARFMIIDRTPFWSENYDGLFIQHVSPRIYQASYPVRFLSQSKFITKIQKEWLLCEEFPSPEGFVQTPAGEIEFKGYLLMRKLQ